MQQIEIMIKSQSLAVKSSKILENFAGAVKDFHDPEFRMHLRI